MAFFKGIDVSRWQGTTIDWKKVFTAGYKFAFIKVTDGSAYKQIHIDNAKKQAEGAIAAGLKIGYYHFAHPTAPVTEDAGNEAQYFLDTLRSFPTAHFPLVLDLEDDKMLLNQTEATAWVAFFEQVLKAGGKELIFYSYKPYADTHLLPKFSHLPLWLAQYPKLVDFNKLPKPANGWPNWSIWQYSQTGQVPGVTGNVDLNIMDEVFFNKF